MLTLLASIAAATLVDSGRRQAQRPKAFQLWATCPDFSSGEIIHYLNEHATEVTYATFARWADLSQLRAEAVVDRLVELGLDRARFSARGAGESDPVADNGTADGRAQNRRIEFLLG